MTPIDDILKKAGKAIRNTAKEAADTAGSALKENIGKAGKQLSDKAVNTAADKAKEAAETAENKLKEVVRARRPGLKDFPRPKDSQKQEEPAEQPQAPVKQKEASAVDEIQNSDSSFTYVFSALPQNRAELEGLSIADLSSPFRCAALTVAALCRYRDSKDDCHEMLGALKGSAYTPFERQFLRDRLSGKESIPFSYFAGSATGNGYAPTQPYTLTVTAGAAAYNRDGYATLELISSGSDSPKRITLIRNGDKWQLYDQALLGMIKSPQ
ncbi:MAG TPA: hypothetical protein GX704_01545 [Clostridiales bacterium]|jgi:hypothetical protein|nr:hypothetical protein [Clostridiales bacterium]